jgi:diguanylate cyclase (GGDEF)-like protein/PAS domain S-box-containing protein
MGTVVVGIMGGIAADLAFNQPVLSPSPVDIATGFGAPFGVVAIVGILSTYLQLARLRTALDSVIVVSSLMFIGWVAALGHITSTDYMRTILDMTPPLTAAGYITVVAFVLFRSEPGERRALWFMLAGLTAFMVTDLVVSYGAVRGRPYGTGHFFEVGWIVGPLLIGMAGLHVQPLHVRRERFLPSTAEAFVPYVAVGAAACASVWWTMRWGPLDSVLTWNAIAILSLLTARQYLVLRENTGLTTALRGSEERFRGLVQHSSDVIGIVGADGRMLYVSPSLEHVLGLHPSVYTNSTLGALIHPDESASILARLDALAGTGETGAPLSFRLRSRSGAWRHVEAVPNDLLADPGIGGITLNMRDVTERVELEEQLRHQTFHDPLTHLANRALLHDRVSQALIRARGDHHEVALLFIDLDDFKTVNDSLGHTTGDTLLRTVADRIVPCVRATDTAARLGGDEFAVLLEESRIDDVIVTAKLIIATLAEPVDLGGTRVHVRASIGIALGAGDDGADHLMRRADVAMYQAKARGKGGYALFDPGMEHGVDDRLAFEEDMRRALADDELVLYYQPVVDLLTGRMIGTEALIRWQHPRDGLLPPARFITLAEETGWIVPIGRWVLKEACRRALTWRRDDGAGFTVSVNVSALHVQNEGFIQDVLSALEESGLAPAELVVEVTESALLADIETARARLGELKAMGVAVALDDFGTGYSSLGHLRDLPVDILKIDRSFLQKLGTEERATEFVRAIQSLGHSLSLTTVAEGVEEPDQLRLLREMHVDHAQGFLFSRPVEAARIDALRGAPPFVVDAVELVHA